MSLNESIVEDAMKRVKSEIGRVKAQTPFPFSLFTIHSSSPRRLNPATPEEVNPQGILVCSKHIERSLNP
jgi:hypothetical protein